MKKVLVYGLIISSIIGVTVMNNSWEDKGKIDAYASTEDISKITLNENGNFEQKISIAQGTTFNINLDKSLINIKHHDKDTVLIENKVSEKYIDVRNDINESEITVTGSGLKEFSNKEIIITIPSNPDFDIEISSDTSQVNMIANKLEDLAINGGAHNINIIAKSIKSMYISSGISDINIKANEIIGNITGNTGIGYITFDIEKSDDLNLKGYKKSGDEIIKVLENKQGKFTIDIQGDIAKVLYK